MTAEEEREADLLDLTTDAGRGEVTVSGGVFTDLDARRLEHELIDAAGTQPGGVLVVDLSGVTFLPSRAIRSLVMAQRAASARGTTLRLLAAEGSLSRRMLRAVGFAVEDPGAADESSGDGTPPWTAS
ncbi:STAS domain-containing protein [Nocardioides zeae]|uniref:STAS domain-containing protein n=1 Tax=Nocardioides zeae TaxID=1457234 RepID=A0A6P0HLI2_9ACTN|nr:STAS domain-containing protein [Nocardioides zeae]NEN79114.1 STAS domain-containing protein [Nocardioides zeae]